MEFIDAIILALVQGITEWLPISSSGHLALIQEIFTISSPRYYDILLHFATLLVILIVFRKEIFSIIKAFIQLDFKSRFGRLGIYIILATIPIGIVGYFFGDYILVLFNNLKIIGLGFIVTGILLFTTKKRTGRKKIKILDSILIGLSQCFALIPGISRSGTTISTGLLLNLNKKDVTTFSFLLAIPAILGATILEFEKTILTSEVIVGFIVAVIIGYISLKWIINIINQEKFYYFGYYCIVIGIISILI
jgi:undecaprenyl-diphosphatase